MDSLRRRPDGDPRRMRCSVRNPRAGRQAPDSRANDADCQLKSATRLACHPEAGVTESSRRTVPAGRRICRWHPLRRRRTAQTESTDPSACRRPLGRKGRVTGLRMTSTRSQGSLIAGAKRDRATVPVGRLRCGGSGWRRRERLRGGRGGGSGRTRGGRAPPRGRGRPRGWHRSARGCRIRRLRPG